MDLSAWLLRWTPPRPFVVTVPGGREARLAAERVVRERGWRFATSPAEANLLVVAGQVTPATEPYVTRVWDQLPAPRSRVDLHSPNAATDLTTAATRLRDVEHQRQQAVRPKPTPVGPDMQETHSHHGHGVGDMPMPGNVPMADRAEDRDGLMLDQLRVPLGPMLPDWPAGLIVRTRLQGDVIQQATVEVLNGPPSQPWSGPARALDSCARLLSVAGWTDASTTARRLRDSTMDGAMPNGLFTRWAKRVRRSRTLRWLLTDIGTTSNAPPELTGDALARLHRWVNLEPTDGTQWTLDHLPTLLEGTELATARLVVASLDPEAGHG